MSAEASLSRQIAALNAEIMLRRKELQKEVAAGRTRQVEADYVIASLEQAADTLRWLKTVERVLKQRLWNGDVAPDGGCW